MVHLVAVSMEIAVCLGCMQKSNVGEMIFVCKYMYISYGVKLCVSILEMCTSVNTQGTIYIVEGTPTCTEYTCGLCAHA